MDLEGIISEISQRNTNTVCFHLHMESKEQNKQTKQKHRYREQNGGCQGFEEWARQVKGIKRYKLPVIK